MITLQSELDRLYHLPAQDGLGTPGAANGLLAPDGRVRALMLALARPADWTLMSALWRGVQTDLTLPAPAIAVSGIDAYQLWFSLAEPVSVAQARAFLESLCLRYLGQIEPGRLSIRPCGDAANPGSIQHVLLPPTLHRDTNRWSAFVAPDLAAIFAEEPWLDLPPNPEAQAKVLARLECITPAGFQAAMARLDSGNGTVTSAQTPVTDGPNVNQASQEAGARTARTTQATPESQESPESSREPKGFLLGVMNDTTVELHLRIDAAKALLPYF